MESLLTLPAGEFAAAELVLRVAAVLVAATATVLGLSTMCVVLRDRFVLILSSVALGCSAAFLGSVWGAWKGAFELAGSDYCVTGLPLAPGDRIVAWAFGVPVLLVCLGLLRLDLSGKPFRSLCGYALTLALVSPFSHLGACALFLVCVVQFRIPGQPLNQWKSVWKAEKTLLTALGSIAGGFLLVGMGQLFPLGGTPGAMLVRGEIYQSVVVILSLVVPALALLVITLRRSRS